MNTRKISPEEARSMVLAQLRKNNYQGKTSELAQWTGLPSSVVRRAGLFMSNRMQLEAELMPGRGKGEYLFRVTQLDLFEDGNKTSLWQKVKSWFK